MTAINRKAIFDAVRALRNGRDYTLAEVRLLDAAIDVAFASGHPAPDFGVSGAEDAFTAALKETLKHEGGYVNHPDDPGGRTNLGVTQRVWEAWTGKRATEASMRAREHRARWKRGGGPACRTVRPRRGTWLFPT